MRVKRYLLICALLLTPMLLLPGYSTGELASSSRVASPLSTSTSQVQSKARSHDSFPGPVFPGVTIFSVAPVIPSPSVQQHNVTHSTPRVQNGSGVWYQIAACESGQNWSTNTGNGYYGGLQMDMTFWRTYSPRHPETQADGTVLYVLDYARPDLAPASVQIATATRARDSGRGYHPWPGCARKLGLI